VTPAGSGGPLATLAPEALEILERRRIGGWRIDSQTTSAQPTTPVNGRLRGGLARSPLSGDRQSQQTSRLFGIFATTGRTQQLVDRMIGPRNIHRHLHSPDQNQAPSPDINMPERR
jgi:hypothetical protein